MVGTYQVFIPFGVASKDVCGLKTLIPFADSLSRDAWMGSSNPIDFSPRNIWDMSSGLLFPALNLYRQRYAMSLLGDDKRL